MLSFVRTNNTHVKTTTFKRCILANTFYQAKIIMIFLFFSLVLIGAQSTPNRPFVTSLEAALHQRRGHINSNKNNNNNNSTVTADNNTHDLSRRACGVATFTQMSNPTGAGVVSQEFSDFPLFSTISMDDFMSPSFPSVICSVTFLTEMVLWLNPGPIVVRIYADSGGLPSPIPAGSFGTPLCQQESATSLGPASSITLNLGNGPCGVLPLLPK